VLRQVNRQTTTEPVLLFDPSDATRSVSRGVAIDYYLKEAADKVTIEILDAQGQVVTTFTSTTAGERGGRRGAGAEDPDEEEGGRGRRGGAPARVTVQQGMNRFTWDMRYPNAKDFPGMILWAAGTRGPQAPPGRYQVRLTTGSVTRTQDFMIQRNPAFAATDADLQEQFKLAKQIGDRVTEANTAVIRIRDLKSQAAERADTSAAQAVKTAAASFAERLTDIEGEIYQYRNQSNQDPLNYPIRLNNKLAALQGTVDGGDARPTDQSYAVFKELSGRLDTQLARLEAFLKTELPAFNKVLTDHQLEPVRDGRGTK
jgi:hypothetical protein